MIGQLILKELKHNSSSKVKWYKKTISGLFGILLLSLFVVLEVIVYSLIFDKVKIYEGFNEALFIVIETSITLLLIIGLIPLIIKMFFGSKEERIVYSTSPLTTYDILLSKSIALFVKTLLFSFSSLFVFASVYGYKIDISFVYYILMFINMIFISLFILGVSLLISIPCYYLFIIIRRNKILTLVITFILAFIIAGIYGYLLHVFIDLIRGQNIDIIFNKENVAVLKTLALYLYPLYPMTQMALLKNIDLNFVIILGISSITLFLGLFAFRFVLVKYYHSSLDANINNKKRTLNFKLSSPTKALINKEFALAFSKDEGILSYLILVILEPFLIFSVVSAINLIFKTGNFNYISTLFPSIYISVDALLIMLFVSFINMSSSISLSKEKDTLMILKTSPITFKKQLLIKILVIFSISFSSYLISLLILLLCKEINLMSFGFLLLIGTSLIFILNLVSILNDLKFNKSSGFLQLLIGFVFPTLIVGIGVIFTLLVEKEVEAIVFYGSLLGFNLILLIIVLTIFMLRVNKMFINYEGGR